MNWSKYLYVLNQMFMYESKKVKRFVYKTIIVIDDT